MRMHSKNEVSGRTTRQASMLSAAALLAAVAVVLTWTPSGWAADHKYVEQSTLLLVYQHYINNAETKADGTHPRHSFTDAEVETFRQQPPIISELLWRASQFRFHLRYVKALVVTTPLTEANLLGDWISAKRIAKDLTENGYKDGSFNLVIVVFPMEGTEKYTVWAGGLPGASEGGEYLPNTRLDVSVYGQGSDVSQSHWVMLHEHQHVLDDWFGGASGLGWGDQEYRNPDEGAWAMPWPLDNGGMECFLATYETSARKWEDWLILGKQGDPSGTQKTLPDNDADGLPDSDPNKCGVPITEETLGTDTTKSDTDGDGVSDKDEAIGDYTGSFNPKAVDTDNDGLLDAVDRSPRYPSINELPFKTPKTDGTINADEYAQFSTFRRDAGLSGTTYAAWNDGMLYLAASITDDKIVTDNPKPEDNDGVQWLLDIDGDGWVRTQDLGMLNYLVRVTRGSDGSAAVSLQQNLCTSGLDEAPLLSNAGVVAAFKTRAGGYDIEVAVPESNLIGATFKHGQRFRMSQFVLDKDGSGPTIQCDTTLSSTNANYPMYVPYMMQVELSGGAKAETAAADTTPPTPSPATFAVEPHREGDKIIMKATAGSDANGPVEYCFVECWGREGRSVRGWSTDPSFEAASPGSAERRYVVYMRDALGNTTHSAVVVCPELPQDTE